MSATKTETTRYAVQSEGAAASISLPDAARRVSERCAAARHAMSRTTTDMSVSAPSSASSRPCADHTKMNAWTPAKSNAHTISLA